MPLKKLLKHCTGYKIKGNKDVEITGISSNSKQVAPGNLFIAKKGRTQEGARYIPDAIGAGAVAILTDLYDPFLSRVVQVIHPDVTRLESILAKEFYKRPDEQLFLIGVTGTSGKTTTAFLIHHLFETLGERCGLLGTVEWRAGEHIYPASHTTPDISTSFKLMHEMIAAGCTSCVMEVSSIGLDQGRVSGMAFDAGVFTNLTPEHLDYHPTMESYAAAKALLFSSLSSHSAAIVNADSPYASQMLQNSRGIPLSYGIDTPCDLYATDVSLSPEGITSTIHYQKKSCPFTSPLIGRFNLYNLLAAAAVGLAKGFALEEILRALSTFSHVPGRLERIPNERGLQLFVDYAHKADALKNVLEALSEVKTGRVITVFGCGGDRDSFKRPQMAAVAETYSDLTIVTTDNPRREDPNAIIRQILTGFKNPGHILVIPDREEAIHKAIELATDKDIVLIAGKGHETYQIFSQETLLFDDRLVAKSALKKMGMC
ncbi:MAG: UDP-N-acetylmuramoyl-L-alanyl-D-glutamate--2,6-diaminopimelate ligase [Verrucomicrobia bacterium]|nr:UDP-N-acetylmuramoyl-L-alanyl-D-glutamate--2,6-diaminopimelate ligase [Verrucomicrobiota bacterium]